MTQTITYDSFGTSLDLTFTGVTLTIGCTIVDVPNPSPPTTGLTYTLYDPSLVIDVSGIPWTQSPPCDYPATDSIVWSIPEPYVIFQIAPLILTVSTVDKSKLGTHTVSVVNTVSYDGGSWSPTYSFDIEILDPCDSTVLQSQSIATLTTDNGVVGTVDFEEVKDSQEVARGQSTLCGPRAYQITYQDDTSIDWVTVAEKTGVEDYWTITADPTLDEHETTHNLKLIVSLTLYPDNAGIELPFNVVVVTPACECNRVGWTAPDMQTLTTTVKKIPADTLTIAHGTVDPDSLLTTPQIRSCQGTCSTTTSISDIVETSTGVIPSFMTLDNGVLTVDAQNNSLIKTYEMTVTMTTPDSGDQTFESVTVVLNLCVITHLDPPTQPSDTHYLIFATSPLSIDLSSPGFQQVPACGYYLVETFTWSGLDNSPITQNTSGGNQYAIDVDSTDPDDDATYSVSLHLSALYATLQTTYE